jgi:hypothetical protein
MIALSVAMLLSCASEPEPRDTHHTADTADTGLQDTGDTAAPSWFEPDTLSILAAIHLQGGQPATITYQGEPYAPLVLFMLHEGSDAGACLQDPETCCQLAYDFTTTGALDLSAEGAWADGAWRFDVSAPVVIGRCGELEPSAWGESVAQTFGQYSWGLGFGPLALSVEFDEGCGGDGAVNSYLQSDMLGGAMQLGTSMVYEVVDGALAGGGVVAEASTAAAAVDGSYQPRCARAFPVTGR